jgi:murein DD-endopeptidase MepM/ murein hydrolase activator NlpD
MRRLLLLTLATALSADPAPAPAPQIPLVSDRMTGDLSLQWPIEAHEVTSRFGYRDDVKNNAGGGDSIHFGIDIIPSNHRLIHAPIKASEDGVVVVAYPAPGGKYRGHPVFGGCLQIRHDTGLKSGAGNEVYLYTFYAHLSEVWVKEGQIVKRGQVVGLMGKTGQADGYHLHYEIAFDPADFLY